MNVNKFIFHDSFALMLSFIASPVLAVQGLDAHGQSKINKATAKKWPQSDPAKGGSDIQQKKTIVNFGNKK